MFNVHYLIDSADFKLGLGVLIPLCFSEKGVTIFLNFVLYKAWAQKQKTITSSFSPQ